MLLITQKKPFIKFPGNITALLLLMFFIHSSLFAVEDGKCKNKAKCGTNNQCSWDKLSRAVSLNQLDFVRNCLKQRRIVKNNNGNPLLITASNNNHYEMAKLLLSSGADVNATGENKMTALLYRVHIHLIEQAMEADREELERSYSIIKLLLDHGANIHHRNSAGQTAFDLAENNNQILQLLKQYAD